MSRNFSQFASLQYIGVPSKIGVGLCTPLTVPPAAIPILIRWSDYGASTSSSRVAVKVNLQQQTTSPSPMLDRIRSVSIDNTFSDYPVYIQFPDTLFTVTCPPRTVGWFPVLTGAAEFTVYMEGFITGNIPQTSLQVSNVDRDGFVVSAETETGVSIVQTDFVQLTIATGAGNVNQTVQLGPASAARLIGLWITAASTVNISAGPPTVTINGVAATLVTTITQASTGRVLQLWTAIVPTGTSGAVVFALAGAADKNCFMSVNAITNYQSITPTINQAATSNPLGNVAPINIVIQTVPGSASSFVGNQVNSVATQEFTGGPFGEPILLGQATETTGVDLGFASGVYTNQTALGGLQQLTTSAATAAAAATWF